MHRSHGTDRKEENQTCILGELDNVWDSDAVSEYGLRASHSGERLEQAAAESAENEDYQHEHTTKEDVARGELASLPETEKNPNKKRLKPFDSPTDYFRHIMMNKVPGGE